MSTLKADTIQSTGGGAATLTKQSAAKAFAQVEADGSAVLTSLNTSSWSDEGTGDGVQNLTNAFSSANYSAIASAHCDLGSSLAGSGLLITKTVHQLLNIVEPLQAVAGQTLLMIII